MSDVRVPPTSKSSRLVQSVAPDGRGSNDQRHEERSQREPSRQPGAEELALALAENGQAALSAHFEESESGDHRIRVIDDASGETVAILTPEELRDLAEQTGLPAGLLLQARS